MRAIKGSLLSAVAAVALIAGAGVASAAEGAADHPTPKAGATEMHKGADVKAGAGMKGQAEKGQAETKGSAAGMNADSKDGAKMNNGSRAQTTSPATGSAETNKTEKNRSTTGAAERDQSGSRAGASAMDSKEQKSEEKGRQHQGTAERSSRDQRGSSSVSLTTEQRTKIRTSVLESKSAPKISRNEINFDVHVGTVVPRSVRVVTVPDTIIEIHPAWRGYRYFVVGDEIVIVEPRSLKIVAVLPA